MLYARLFPPIIRLMFDIHVEFPGLFVGQTIPSNMIPNYYGGVNQISWNKEENSHRKACGDKFIFPRLFYRFISGKDVGSLQ